MDLPCRIELWEAESPQAWTDLHAGTSGNPPNKPLGESIDSVFEDHGPVLDAFPDHYQRSLLLMVLIRMLWSYREANFEPGARFLPTYAPILETRNFLISRLASFFFPLVKPSGHEASQRMMASQVHEMYLLRYGMIVGNNDLNNYMHLVWAMGPRAKKAWDHIVQWATWHPQKVRECAYASAQALNLARSYRYNHPQEPYNAFHGGLIFWTMARLLKLLQSPRGWENPARPATQTPRHPACHLDFLGSTESVEARVIQDWIRRGEGPSILTFHGVPDLLDEKGLKRILELTAEVLQGMQVWGIAQSFLSAVVRIIQAEEL